MKKIVIIVLLFTISLLSFSEVSQSKILNVNVNKLKVDYIPDLVYSQPVFMFSQNTKLKMDILKPSVKEKLPVVVFITGGAYLGSPKENYLQQRMYLAEAGYLVASIEYRTVPTVMFPTPLEDVKTAVRYLKENADRFGIDTNKIAVMGESAGGHLAALMGTTNGMKDFDKGEYLNQTSDIKATIDLYGPSDLAKIAGDYSKEIQDIHDSPSSPESMFVNGFSMFTKSKSIMETPEKVKVANPITYISAKTTPFLLMHGDKDFMVSPSQTDNLYKALIEKNIVAIRYVVKGAGHGDIYWNQEDVLKVIVEFLDKTLK
ncbi:MAG: alpha/beta hydrolase [Fusobacteriaceae bacterium]|nr:alpha/beta hydrolase [Fusobacteriaceae bacterium]MBN2838691.1 alpha/beta hydrolase [Fusobacteriaceae bacterium]